MENFTFIQEAVGPSMFHTADGSEAMPPDEYDYVDDVLLRSVDMSLYGGLDERGMPLVWNARDPRLTRNLRVVTPVRFQATCNACVAFTVMAAAETAYALSLGLNATNASSPGGGINFSEQHLWFCGGGAVAADPAPDCATGWTMDAALQALQAHGVYREGCYPWDVTRGSRICEPGSAFWDPGYRVPVGSSSTSTVSVPSSCGKVPGRWEVLKRDWDGVEQVNATAVKQLVRQAGSAMACFRLYEDMYEHGGGVYRWDGASRQEGWHCAQLLGWDDPQGYWLFKSSWGTGVGDKGFFKLAYGEADVMAWGVWALVYHPE